MRRNRQTQFALLIAVITLALAGATVSMTTGTFVDREEVTVDVIKVDADGNESVTDDSTRSNGGSDDEMTEDESGNVNGTDTGNQSEGISVPDGDTH